MKNGKNSRKGENERSVNMEMQNTEAFRSNDILTDIAFDTTMGHCSAPVFFEMLINGASAVLVQGNPG